MKKALVIGVGLLVFVFMFSSLALAEITTSGSVQWKIYGSDEKPGGFEVASPRFKYGDVRMHYDIKMTSGPWEALFAPRIRLDKDPELVEDNGSYLKVYLDSSSVMLKPRLDYGLFDVYSVTHGDPANIPKEPGVKLDLPFKPLDMSLDLVLNSTVVYKSTGGTTGAGDQETKWNYGAGLSFAAAPIGVALQFITTDVTDYNWYGSAYGAKLTADLAPVSLEAQFASFSPEAAGKKDGSGIFAKVGYALGEGLGSLSLEYKGSDKEFNGLGTATADNYSKIKGKYTYPLAEAVNMEIAVASIDKGLGEDDFTEYEVKFAASL
ncbi:MAG: porin [bacterium]